jgi:hypothetical protein
MRWPWTKPEPGAEELDLRTRVRSIDDDVHALKRDMKQLALEWDGQFSKYQALYARLAKQARRAEQASEVDLQHPNGDPVGVEASPPTAHLSARFRRF